ncbi:MAG: TerC/Alx family metal homeostasis membrane protein [Candidatus Hatepunaea meridiana]|nr:TerC/Alx family metal homeostasis membrane protein [Candidatus Hatepunaea meridiana]
MKNRELKNKRHKSEMPPGKALRWVITWFILAMGFSWVVRHYFSTQLQVEFLTCYAVEWSLSLDNLFVFLMIFEAFGVDTHRQIRVLWWGIAGAMVLRMVFIFLGVALVQMFEPILYVFGAFLIYSAYMMAFSKEGTKDVKNNVLVRLVRRRFSVTKNFHGDAFFIRRMGITFATPMLLVLVAIESSDVMFAVDSIPAAFAITRNPFIIYSANIFAILGLRSLYFLLAQADRMFRFLKYGISFILAFVGFKMLAAHHIEFNEYISLGIILISIVGSILLSVFVKNENG